MKKYFYLFIILISLEACVPPGKLNESLVNVNNLSKSLDGLKSDHANTLMSFQIRESNLQQQIAQLRDSISLVMRACAETPKLSDTSGSLNNSPQFVIYFDFDKFNLVDSSFLILSNVVDLLKRNDDYSCVLQGYTDLEGPRDYNLKLSEKRVLSARNYLLSYGISAKRITGSFFGKTFPNIETRDRVANWLNRRVEIFLVRK